jgi:hypothetical protein
VEPVTEVRTQFYGAIFIISALVLPSGLAGLTPACIYLLDKRRKNDRVAATACKVIRKYIITILSVSASPAIACRPLDISIYAPRKRPICRGANCTRKSSRTPPNSISTVRIRWHRSTELRSAARDVPASDVRSHARPRTIGRARRMMWAREMRDAEGVRHGQKEDARWIEGYERVAEMAANMADTRLCTWPTPGGSPI